MFLVSDYTGIFNPFNEGKLVRNEAIENISIQDFPYNPIYGNYTYVNNVNETIYFFNAKGPCYVLAEVGNIDFTSFRLDNDIYNVSYGLNTFSIDFGVFFRLHNITIDQSVIDGNYLSWLAVEPLYLKEDTVSVNLTEFSVSNFLGAGLVSILIQPDFSYNWLYLEVDNIILNNIYNTSEYPEIDSAIFSYYYEGGPYIRFDLNLDPNQHVMKLKGNGTLNYKIMLNLDWDKDQLPDVEEVQQQIKYERLDPTVPNVWGVFEKSTANPFTLDSPGITSGVFRFYVPNSYEGIQFLHIYVEEGNVSNIVVDNDSISLRGIELWQKIGANYSDYYGGFDPSRNGPSNIAPYGVVEPGYHVIKYDYSQNINTKILFKLDGREIINLDLIEFRDTDTDGLLDVQEINNGLAIDNIDTDYDGLPDNVDPSPLDSLQLYQNRLKQFIIPTNPENHTTINLLIQKPDLDYTTLNNREWCPDLVYGERLEVMIQPVLRLFGNPSTSRSKLISNYQFSSTVDLFNLVAGYNSAGVGDSIPNKEDPNAISMFIFPQISETNLEYNIHIPKGHPAKTDGILDLRFDIGWLVTYINATGYLSVLHFYKFESNVRLQSMVVREFKNVTYILGAPDTLIEHQVLWALTQNPTLAANPEFELGNSVVGMGSIDYFELPNRTIADREARPRLANETEVLYVTGFRNHCDLLRKINSQTSCGGSYSYLVSFYTINNVYTDVNYTIEDGEIRGDSKICYVTAWNDYSDESSTDYELVTNLLGFPIHLNVTSFANSKILTITYAIGNEIPLTDVPYSMEFNIYEKIDLRNQTIIEKINTINEIPRLIFNEDIHIYKEHIDNRQDQAEKSKLFFDFGKRSLSKSFLNYLEDLVNVTSQLINITNQIPEFPSYFEADFFEQLSALQSSMEKVVFLNDLHSKIQNYPFNEIKDTIFELGKEVELGSQMNQLGRFIQFYNQESDNFEKLVEDITELWDSGKGDNDWVDIQIKLLKLDRNSVASLKRMDVIDFVSNTADFVFGIVECYSLVNAYFEGKFEGKTADFVYRLVVSIAHRCLEVLELLDSAIPILTAAAKRYGWQIGQNLGRLSKWVPKIIKAIGIALAIADLVVTIITSTITLIETYQKYGLGVEFTVAVIQASIQIGLAALAVGLALSSNPIGWIVALAITIFVIFSDWIFHTNTESEPEEASVKLEILTDPTESYFTVNKAKIQRRGSLEVGDTVALTLTFDNTGTIDCDYLAWMGVRRHNGVVDWDGTFPIYQRIKPSDAPKSHTWVRTLTEPSIDILVVTSMRFYYVEYAYDILFPWVIVDEYITLYYDQIDRMILDIPVVPTTISAFYASTYAISKYDYEMMKDSFQRALEDYQYADACEILEVLRHRLAFDFLEEADGTFPSGFADQSSSGGVLTRIQAEKEGHRKVLKLDDGSTTGGSKVGQGYSGNPNVGSIEFWLYQDAPQNCDFLVVLESSLSINKNFGIIFGADHHIYYVMDISVTNCFYYSKDLNNLLAANIFFSERWYHVRIDYTLVQFEIRINGIKLASRGPLRTDSLKINQLFFQTGIFNEIGDIGTFYIDGLDNSWSPGYYPGRSLYSWNYTLSEINSYNLIYNTLPVKVNFEKDLAYSDVFATQIIPNNVWADGQNKIYVGHLFSHEDYPAGLPGEYNHYIQVNISFLPNSINLAFGNSSYYSWNQYLASSITTPFISFNWSFQIGGLYYLKLEVRLVSNGKLIFSQLVPFRIILLSEILYMQSSRTWNYDNTSFYFSNGNPIVQPLHPIIVNSGNVNHKFNSTYNMGSQPITATIGQILQINCITNSTKEITLRLFNDTQEIKNFTLLPRGNNNFQRQLIELIIDENLTFNQFSFDANFQGSEFIQVINPTLIDTSMQPPENTYFETFDFLNLGTVPLFVELEVSGVPWDAVDTSLYPAEFDGEKQFITIMPWNNRSCIFNISKPSNFVSNLMARTITARDAITGAIIARYTDYSKIEGIYLITPQNTTYKIYRRDLHKGLLLSIIPQEKPSWCAYSLDGKGLVNFSNNDYIPLPPEGTHTIQIFGMTANNTGLESELRYFTIKDFSMKFIHIVDKLYWPTEPINLNFTVPVRLTRCYYIVDNQYVYSLPENRSITYSKNGDHVIQLFGIDADGVIYETVPSKFAVFCTKVSVNAGTNVFFYAKYTDIDFNFTQINEAGTLTVSYINKLPNSFPPYFIRSILEDVLDYYEVSADFSYSGNIRISLPYDYSEVGRHNEKHLKLLHYTPTSGWSRIETLIDTHYQRIYGETASLGIFVAVIAIDTYWPSTYCYFEGTPSPCLSNEFISHINVTLDAIDTASMIAETKYSIGQGNSYYSVTYGPWQTYTGPFHVAYEGYVGIRYYSIDYVGNQEPIIERKTYIDTIPPNTSLFISSYDVNPTDGSITVIRDSKFYLYINERERGLYYRINNGNFTDYEGSFQLQGYLGVYTIEYYGQDLTGWVEPEIHSITVTLVNPPSFQSEDLYYKKVWEQVFPDLSYYYDITAIGLDSSGNIVFTEDILTYSDVHLIKCNINGSILWQQTWNGALDDVCEALCIDVADNIYLAGYTESFGATGWDLSLVKYDSSGTLLWQKLWDTGQNEGAYDMVLDNMGNIYVSGQIEYPNSSCAILVKFDSAGSLLWNRTFNSGWRAAKITIDSSNNLYLGIQAENALHLVKYTSSGDLIWYKTWNHGALYTQIYDLELDSEGNIYVTLSIGYQFFGLNRFLKFDPSGNLLWVRDSAPYYADLFIDASDNIYVVGGGEVAKFDTEGNELWSDLRPSCLIIYAAVMDSEGDLYLAGEYYWESSGICSDSSAAWRPYIIKVTFERPRQVVPGFEGIYLIISFGLLYIFYLSIRRFPKNPSINH